MSKKGSRKCLYMNIAAINATTFSRNLFQEIGTRRSPAHPAVPRRLQNACPQSAESPWERALRVPPAVLVEDAPMRVPAALPVVDAPTGWGR